MRKLTTKELEQHIENIRVDGFSIMENAIDDEFRSAILDELAHLARLRPGGDIAPGPFTGMVTRRWFDVLNDGDIWQQIAVHPWILQVQEKVLGEGFLLSTMGSAIVGDGEPAQAIHVDDGVYAFPRPHHNLVCNTMWALSEFTEETGATRVVHGSHNWEKDPDFGTHYDTIPLVMPTGSLAFVVGSLYHGAGHNTSGKDRIALTINYCNGRMRQQENLMMSVHPSRMLGFAKELQDILGFKICQGAGHMFAQDPRDEMERHYGPPTTIDEYQEKRHRLHAERLAARQQGTDPV